VDRLFYLVMIFAALWVLTRRRLSWQSVIFRNWPVFLFYGFLLVSVLWANSPFVSFKRWYKEFGNIVVLLVILTEEEPQQALRAVFVRCGYVLIPLSEVFIRWFPNLGRLYTRGGAMEATGVTRQKNLLGVMVMVCGLLILWDWLELWQNRGSQTQKQARVDSFIRILILSIGIYLLNLCDSKTSIVCLAVSAGLLFVARLPFLRQRLAMLGALALAGALALYALDQTFHLKDQFLNDLGRDATLTGRTDVWRELLNAGTPPMLGTGFMSFWDDQSYQSKLPEWMPGSAHNGYLEIYLGGGWVGIFFLSLMLVGVGLRINNSLSWGGDYSVFRFAVYVMALLGNYSESSFAWMTPLGFLFLFAAIGYAGAPATVQSAPDIWGVANDFEQSEVNPGRTEAIRS
jgi:O-antigen ligase